MPSDDIARLYDFQANTTAQSGQVDEELNQVVSTLNTKAGRGIANTFTAHQTLASATMSSTLTLTHATTPCLTDKVGEYTVGAGVTIDGVRCKDNLVKVSGTPTEGGELGYSATALLYHNGTTVKTVSAINVLDDLSDVTITTPASGQVPTYNGSAWVNTYPGLTLLASAAASSSASVDFISAIDSTYDEYLFVLSGVLPATDAVNLHLQLSTNGGSSWLSASYNWAFVCRSNGVADATSATGDSKILLNDNNAGVNISNAAGEVYNAEVRIFNPAATQYKGISYRSIYINPGSGSVTGEGGAHYLGATTAINAVRFIMSSGNIASGNFYMYGVKKS